MVYTYCLTNTKHDSLNQVSELAGKLGFYSYDSTHKDKYIYFDTFDWRLYRSGYFLYTTSRHLTLFNYKRSIPEISEEYQRIKGSGIPFQDGPLFSRIGPLTGIRAIIRQIEIHRTTFKFRLLNDEKKTIANLIVDLDKVRSAKKNLKLDPVWQIRPLRGYTNEIDTLLKKSVLDFRTLDEDLLKRSLKAAGKSPAVYSGKISIQLKPHMPAERAIKDIYLHLLDQMRKNEQGIIDDIDTEFLHDYRVSIRRTRSGISQLRHVLDPQITEKTRKIFSFLGSATNHLRDIDVYLLSVNHYKGMVPLHLKKYLDPFFDNLKMRRKKEWRELVKHFHSAKYRQALADWESYLKNDALLSGTPKKELPSVQEVAFRAIEKRNQKMLKLGKKISGNTKAELLHKLRIEAKKLRYLLEFFSSLVNQEKMQTVLKYLRQLQDNLGEYNDLTIQQYQLEKYAGQIKVKDETDLKTTLVIGILIGKLNEREQQVKTAYTKTYKQYAAREIQKQLKLLLSSGEKF